ncbi:hypothetical protein AMATHDRAFT_150842 [Amanita thiersii Skay4041]|uniref:Uncharacterized protein n=1 Tax=Amanita thiersii Skay4041 TaxID=703135 RepID=A0A2A9NF83_9AGAR|nr:hypothetical protein AMATHDRAFT_150842 [Amanita thiersii Skay4041]
MLHQKLGYPLYMPEPDRNLPIAYRMNGISIGDVGRITPDGAFDFLFNICSPADDPMNPSVLPEKFEFFTGFDVSTQELFGPETDILSQNVTCIGHFPATYQCTSSKGAILELPDGAVLTDTQSKACFRNYAARHAEDWYRYMNVCRGRDAPNGSLYLVTGCIKSTSWAIATFDRPSCPGDYLQFVTPCDLPPQQINGYMPSRRSHHWKRASGTIGRAGPSSTDLAVVGAQNQCTFLRGFKITLQSDVWNRLVTSVSVTAANGVSNTDSSLFGPGPTNYHSSCPSSDSSVSSTRYSYTNGTSWLSSVVGSTVPLDQLVIVPLLLPKVE